MANVKDFVEEYNKLVIEGTATTYFQIVLMSSDDVWNTFIAPADPEKVEAALANVSTDLPTGKHTLQVQAMGDGNIVRARMSQNVEGRSAAARQANNDVIAHAKAVSLNIETAEIQMRHSNARSQVANERAETSERHVASLVADGFKMQEICHKMIIEKESAAFDEDERAARMHNMKAIAETFVPMLGPVVKLGMKWLEYRTRDMEERWAEEADARAKDRKNNGSRSDSPN